MMMIYATFPSCPLLLGLFLSSFQSLILLGLEKEKSKFQSQFSMSAIFWGKGIGQYDFI
ncbi:hypothetical protein BCR42DRAFT_409705 [Absidia repens]|uniref:Uncharacterized protein n=1 Tax=Absidia repens TaxID=90262 RepID=A0A1X2IN15_9FUNG|nr:hypothetical protein BCR42DRAFT_409705 [Absidia repens]